MLYWHQTDAETDTRKKSTDLKECLSCISEKLVG